MSRVARFAFIVASFTASLLLADGPNSLISPQAGIDAEHGTSLVKRGAIIEGITSECAEISKRLKADPPGTAADQARLKELHAELDRLDDESLTELRRAGMMASPYDPDHPSDVYFKGWLLCREAEKLKEQDRTESCREKLEQVLKLFEQITKEHPDWKPQMVQGRLKHTKETLAALPPAGK